jgi:hypothetical protein
VRTEEQQNAKQEHDKKARHNARLQRPQAGSNAFSEFKLVYGVMTSFFASHSLCKTASRIKIFFTHAHICFDAPLRQEQ